MQNLHKKNILQSMLQQNRNKLKSRWLFSFCLIFLLSLSSNYLLAQPPNDDLADAIQVTSLPFSHDVFDDSATSETSEISALGSICMFNDSWWYTFTVITAGDFEFSLICAACTGSTGDGTLGIYTGSNHPLNEVYCQDLDNENSNGESTTQTLAVGTYYLRVTNGGLVTPNNPPITTTISSAGGVVGGSGAASIPTLSEWGLIILALLLMTLGTLYLVQLSTRFEQE